MSEWRKVEVGSVGQEWFSMKVVERGKRKRSKKSNGILSLLA